MIAIQEMNLVHKYGQLFWNTACLTVNAGDCDEESIEEDEEDESESESNEDNLSDAPKKKKKAVKYDKIAKAIGDMRKRNVTVLLPDINTSKSGFNPDIERNGILYGFRAISGVGDDIIESIIENRPFSSFEDFFEKVKLTTTQLIPLIKAGCFNQMYPDLDRKEIILKGLYTLSSKQSESKTKLNMQNFPAIVKMDILPQELKIYERYYKFRNYINQLPLVSDKAYIQLDKISTDFFMEHFKDVEHVIDGESTYALKKNFEKIYKKKMDELKIWLTDESTLDKFNDAVVQSLVNEAYDKYCNGSVALWEMSSLNFYHGEHELANIDKVRYLIQEFASLPEEPVFVIEKSKGREFKKYDLSRICGTVIAVEKTRHVVYLLTPEGDVVNIKFYAGAFTHYYKRISAVNPSTGKKGVVEESWFKRGTKLIISGFRRGDYFYPRRYFNSAYQHTVCKIEIDNNSEIYIQTERENPNESN